MSITEPRPRFYGVATDYDRNNGRRRDYLTVWSGPFCSVWEADGVSLPNGDGYMLTTYNGVKIRVTCPAPRTEENFQQVDDAVAEALRAHYSEPAPEPAPVVEGTPARPELPRTWDVTYTETITRRITVTLPDELPEWADADDQAAHLLELVRANPDGPGETTRRAVRLDEAQPRQNLAEAAGR